MALYSFRYRSKEALQSMYLIPRTPEPIPLEDRPIEDLTAEEMRELLRRQKVSHLYLAPWHKLIDTTSGAIGQSHHHQKGVPKRDYPAEAGLRLPRKLGRWR